MMSILNRALGALKSLLWPNVCAMCGNALEEYENFICVDCMIMMPRTSFHTNINNPMAERLRSLSPSVAHAASLFYFHDKSHWRNFIHRIKYGDGWRDALTIGRIYGAELRDQAHFSDLDLIIPVPLHPIRRMSRGYNQSEYIAKGVGKAMGVKVLSHALRRVRNNSSQTKHSVEQRWSNVDSLFAMRKGCVECGAHILLVDDVFTTGATISACIEAILKVAPDVKISVVTLAASAKHFRFNA